MDYDNVQQNSSRENSPRDRPSHQRSATLYNLYKGRKSRYKVKSKKSSLRHSGRNMNMKKLAKRYLGGVYNGGG